MKKHILITVLALIIAIALDLTISLCEARPHQVYSRSFMATRPIYQHLSTQQSFWHTLIYNKKGINGAALRVMGLYQKSFSMNKTAQYFLPPCTHDVLVAGDDTPVDVQCARNIRAEWIGLDPQFRGSFTINPKQQQYGFSLEYNQNLDTLFECEFLKNYWISVSVPIISVQNNINLQQTLINAPEPKNPMAPRTICQAFQQESWCYGKIGGSTHTVKAAEIRVNIGNWLVSENYFQFAYNSIFIAPAGNKQNACEMFQAIAGNNQHFAFGAAVFFQFPLNRNTDEYGICFFTNLESIFNIRNTQRRTMDLVNKPWSRYMLYNQRCDLANDLPGAQNIPGVNILTHSVLVRPYGVFDFSMGWRFAIPGTEAEFGYNIWGKSNERVELKRPYTHPCQYMGIYGIAGTEPNTSASTSTIAQRGPNDPEFVAIDDIFDLDPISAESGSVLNHKVHFSIGTRRENISTTSFVATGAYIDIPQKNTTLRVWGAWFSCGALF